MYHEVPVERTIEDLYDGSLDDTEITDFISANIEAAQKEYNSVVKKTPKIGTDKARYLQEKKAYQAETDKAKAKVDYWQAVENERQRITHTSPEELKNAEDELSGEAARRDYRSMTAGDADLPASAEDLVRDFLRGAKILPEDFRRETGLSLSEQKKFVGMISKQGKTIARLGEELADYDAMNLGGRFFDGDSNAARGAIIDALLSSRTRGDFKQQDATAEEERYMEAVEQQREQWYYENYHMTYEEYLQYREIVLPELLRKYANFAPDILYPQFVASFEDAYAAEHSQTNNTENNEQQRNDTTAEEPTTTPGDTVLQTEETNNSRGDSQSKEQPTEVPTGVRSSNENGTLPQSTPTEVDEPQPIGNSFFGKVYNQFKGKAKEAVNFLMRHRSGKLLGVFHRNDIGEISLVWGDEKGGLAHIISKHIVEQNDFNNIDEVINTMQQVINNGTITRENKDKVVIDYNDYRVAIRKQTRDNNGNVVEQGNWIVTAFDKSRSKKDKTPSEKTLSTPLSNQETDGVTLPSNGVSADKVTQSSQTKQEKENKFSPTPRKDGESITDYAERVAEEHQAQRTRKEEEAKVDTNPTEAQKEAGNYKKGHIKVDGLNITIEQPKGSIRRGTDANGKQWESEMHNTYGYIRGTESVDGDHIDIFLSDNPTEGKVFVVDQVNKDGSFDEHKVMYGFSDMESARQAYLSNYEEGWQGLGNITEVSKEEFKKWIDSSKRKTKPFAEYTSVKTQDDTEAQKLTEIPHLTEEEKREQRKQELRNKIKAKLRGQLNVGVDPELFMMGVELASMEIEDGVRKFADFTKKMIAEIGDEIRPYLKSIYNGARDLPGMEELSKEMTPYDEVRVFNVATIGKETEDVKPSVFDTAEQISNEQAVEHSAKEEVKNTVETQDVDNDVYSITKQHNNKKDIDIWVVRGKEHTDSDAFKERKQVAKKHNGYYSSFRGVNGFVFNSPEDAQSFADKVFDAKDEQTNTETNENYAHNSNEIMHEDKDSNAANLLTDSHSEQEQSEKEAEDFARQDLKELEDFQKNTDTTGRTAIDEDRYDAEDLFAALKLDGKPSKLGVLTVEPDKITDPVVQIAVYDYSDEIDDKTNSGWQKWGDLADEYNKTVDKDDKAQERGDTATLGFRTVDAAVKFSDWLNTDGQTKHQTKKTKKESKDNNVFLSQKEYVEKELKSVLKQTRYKTLEEWESKDVGDYSQKYDDLLDIYEDYVRDLADDERLQAIYDKSSVKAQKEMREHLTDADLDYHEFINTSPKRIRIQERLTRKSKYAKGEFADGTIVSGEVIRWSPTSLTVNSRGTIYTINANKVLQQSDKPMNADEHEYQRDASLQYSGETLTNDTEAKQKATEAVLAALSKAGIEVVRATDEEVKALLSNSHATTLRTPQGTIYGWSVNGKIYLTEAGINPDTPIHEYTHLWAEAMMIKNKKGWDSIKALLKDNPIWNEVVADANYSNIADNEDAVASEVLSRISGRKNAAKMEEEAQRAIDEAKGVFEKARATTILTNLKKALNSLWKWVSKNIFDVKEFSSINEVTDKVLYDLIHGTKLINDKSLIGVHNISEQKLRKVLKQGGFANPSIAVIDTDKQVHNDYGEISLILPSRKVNKSTGKNVGTYEGDAWTPMYPIIEKQMSSDGSLIMHNDINSVPNEMQSEVRNALNRWLDNGSDTDLSYLYLFQQGKAPKMATVKPKYSNEVYKSLRDIMFGVDSVYNLTKGEVKKLVELYVQTELNGDIDEYNKANKRRIAKYKDAIESGRTNSMYYKIAESNLEEVKKYGYPLSSLKTFADDVQRDKTKQGSKNVQKTLNAASQIIKDAGLEEDFRNWVEGLNNRYQTKEVIFDGFTPTGKRRYIPNTLENVSKLMKKQGRQASTGLGVSFSNFAASVMKANGSLANIRKKKSKLTNEHKDIENFEEKWKEVYFDLAMKLQPNASTFDDYGFTRLQEAALEAEPQAFLSKEYGVTLSKEDVRKLQQMVKAIQEERPAMYFETKFERPVTLNEFSKAVIPEDLSDDLQKTLRDNGIEIFTYKRGDAEDRQKATQEAAYSSDDIAFQIISNGNNEANNDSNPRFQIVGNSLSDEEKKIVETAKANDTYMKAPNGKPTNLSEKQWAQVRTTAFKNWFGDWEKAARIEKLRRSKAVKITGEEIEPNSDLKQYKKNALEYGKNLRGEYTNKDTGETIALTGGNSRGGMREILQHDYKDIEHLQSIAAIPQIIEKAIFVDEAPNEDAERYPGVKSFRYYVCGLKIGNTYYTVKAVVAVQNNGDRYYDHKLSSIEKGKLLSIIPTIQKAGIENNLPPSVGKDKRLLSILQTNSSKVVDENGEPMVVYHGSNNEFTKFDTARIGSSTGTSDGRGFYFTTDKDYANSFGKDGNVLSVFLNIDNPLSLKEKTITKRQLFDIIKRIDEKEVAADGEHWLISNYANYYDVGIDGAIREAAESEYPYSDNDVELVNSLISASGNFKDVVNSVYEVTGKSSEIVPKENGTVHYVVTNPNQIKSATSNNGNFSTTEDDILYRTVFGGNSGYVGYSMSKRAAEAKEEGRYPKTEFKREYHITEKSLDMLTRLGFIDNSEWHHTSMYGNKTPFYGWTEDEFADDYLKHKKEVDTLCKGIDPKTKQPLLEKVEKPQYEHEYEMPQYGEAETAANPIREWRHKQIEKYDQFTGFKGYADATEEEKKERDAYLHSLNEQMEEKIREMLAKDFPDYLAAKNALDAYNNYEEDLRKAIGEHIKEYLDIDKYSQRWREQTATTQPTTNTEELTNHAESVVQNLHLNNVEIVPDGSSLNGEQATAKGFYNKRTGKIVVVAGNHTDIADIEKTVLHEAVAHHGLRELFGDNFDNFLDTVFAKADIETRRQIAHLSAKHGWNIRTATEEYLASMAEDTNFEQIKPTLWQRIKQLFGEIMNAFGLHHAKLTDNDLRYILWRSYKNLQGGGKRSILDMAEDIATQYRLKVGNHADKFTNELNAVNERFNEELSNLTEDNADKVTLWLGKPSKVLLAAGVEDKPMKLYGNKVIRKMKKHGFSLEELRNLPRAVADPIAVFDNIGREGNRSVLTELHTENGNFLVAIDLGKGKEDIDFNIISSVFGKGDNGSVLKPSCKPILLSA